jgi:hypothetical protein
MPDHNIELARATENVESARRIYAAQVGMVKEIEAEGGDARLAQSLLDTFRRTLKDYEDSFSRLSGKER